MTVATRLRAIVRSSAHIPTAPAGDVHRIGEFAAIPALAQAESAKKRLRADATGRTGDPADPEARVVAGATDRPLYILNNGLRGAATGQRAASGTRCLCNILRVGSYCAVEGYAQGQGAFCSEVQ
jgi:hypothetical protein